MTTAKCCCAALAVMHLVSVIARDQTRATEPSATALVSGELPCFVDARDVDAWNWRAHSWGVSVTTFYNRGRAYRAIGWFDQAIADYNEAIRLEPTYHATFFGRAGAYAEKGDLDRAIADYTAALALRPTDGPSAVGRGYAYLTKGEWNKAVSDFSAAADGDKTDADAPYGSAIAWEHLGDIDAAIRGYTQAIENDPKNAGAHLSRGALFARKAEPEKANADFSAAARLRPVLAAALVRKGKGYVLNGEWDSLAGAFFQRRLLFPALTRWRAAIRLHPEAAGMIGVAAWVMSTGPCAIRSGNEKEALDLALRGAKLTGEQDPVFLDILAAAYRASHEIHETVQTAEQALALAERQHNFDLATEISARLKVYQKINYWFDKDIVNEPR